MCDTLVATTEVTSDHIVMLAKNSDREPNEAQHLLRVPAADYPAGARVRCTYIEIPQVAHTYAVLLSKPYWMWGAEMGVNEMGVAIGNEAVFTRLPVRKTDTLLGMDLLRLALERAATAQEAVAVITSLMERYGQGGNASRRGHLFYHNSYLIADPTQAWVLETADAEWAARRVQGVYSISNRITLTNQWDLASPGLVKTALQHGWCKTESDFDFGRCYSDYINSTFSKAAVRRSCTLDAARALSGNITPQALMQVLRSHGAAHGGYRPDRSLAAFDVCAHASFGPIRGSQSTGSLVAYLHPDHPAFFLTGTSAPCTGIFKPFWVDTDLPAMGPAPTDVYDPACLYWQHEELHRASLRDYPRCLATYQHERDELERQFVEQALALAASPAAERSQFSQDCLTAANQAEGQWKKRVNQIEPRRRNVFHVLAWNKFNRQAKL